MDRKTGYLMRTQEDRMTDLEKNMTILLGIVSGQERDLKSIQLGVMSLQGDLRAVEGRLYTLEKDVDGLKGSMAELKSVVETQNRKLDQILFLLTPKSE